jgi:hypothetical protein
LFLTLLSERQPEFAHPYEVLSPHCDITIASSEGGSSAIVDPVSIEQFKGDAYCVEFLDTKQELWKHTEKLESFLGRAKEFAAILYVGGFGRNHPSLFCPPYGELD